MTVWLWLNTMNNNVFKQLSVEAKLKDRWQQVFQPLFFDCTLWWMVMLLEWWTWCNCFKTYAKRLIHYLCLN